MFPFILLIIVVLYFSLLLGIAFYTSRHATNQSFFIGNRNSKWWVVAFGMVGTSLSGITFISVPGTVGKIGLDYLQVTIGYVLGYFVVAYVLLPLYYRLHLTSIYTYLYGRFGNTAYKTGAIFFIISRTLGATLRLYLVINVLDKFVLAGMGISFTVTTLCILVLILLYTYRGGVKTIVWTDTLQTTFMLLALIVCVGYILHTLNYNIADAYSAMNEKGFTKLFETNATSSSFYLKQIIGGAFITIAMTGLDQEMMQKNISVSNLKDAQKNMITLSFLQAFAVVLFLLLGGLLYLFATKQGGEFTTVINQGKPTLQFLLNGKNIIGDDIFPVIAFSYLPPFIGIIFIIGLISALFPSADGALTALTSSFCIDILGILDTKNKVQTINNERNKPKMSEQKQTKTRHIVHYSFAIIFLICVFLFRAIDNGSIVQLLLVVAGYTYGPLLALFAFGIFTKRMINNKWLPVVCVFAPILCYILKQNDAQWLNGYHIGTELLIINALFTFLLLFSFSKNSKPV